jgi:hypothetical protein
MSALDYQSGEKVPEKYPNTASNEWWLSRAWGPGPQYVQFRALWHRLFSGILRQVPFPPPPPDIQTDMHIYSQIFISLGYIQIHVHVFIYVAPHTYSTQSYIRKHKRNSILNIQTTTLSYIHAYMMQAQTNIETCEHMAVSVV